MRWGAHAPPLRRDGRPALRLPYRSAEHRLLQANSSPPFTVVANQLQNTTVAFPDGHFDLIYAISAFTHITDEWADMARRTAPPPMPGAASLLVTTHGPGARPTTAFGEISWDDDRIGMPTFEINHPLGRRRPVGVYLSRGIREKHSGAAVRRRGDRAGVGSSATRRSWPWTNNGYVMMRKLERGCSVEELQRVDPSHSAKVAALSFQNQVLLDELRRDRRISGRQGIVRRSRRRFGDHSLASAAERDEAPGRSGSGPFPGANPDRRPGRNLGRCDDYDSSAA